MCVFAQAHISRGLLPMGSVHSQHSLALRLYCISGPVNPLSPKHSDTHTHLLCNAWQLKHKQPTSAVDSGAGGKNISLADIQLDLMGRFSDDP